MKHRFLVTALASVILASSTGVGAIVSRPQPVQAISKYSYHWHWVTCTKETDVYRVKVGKYMYKSKLIYDATLPKGYHFQVRWSGHDYGWYLRKLGAGTHGAPRVVLRHNARWFRNGR